MRLTSLLTLTFLAAFLMQGCASPKVSQLSSDTYEIYVKDTRGVFGDPAEVKASVINQAQELANSKNMTLEKISLEEKPMKVGGFYWIDYKFRLVSPVYMPARSASESKSASLEDANETPSQKKSRLAAEKKAEEETARYEKQRAAENAKLQREREKEIAKQEKARQLEIARIQREGDGSPDDQTCKTYGFKPNTSSYAECRQKIDMARAEAQRQQAIYARQMAQYEREMTLYQQIVENERKERQTNASLALMRIGLGMMAGGNRGAVGSSSNLSSLPPPTAPTPPYTQQTYILPGGRSMNCTTASGITNCQ